MLLQFIYCSYEDTSEAEIRCVMDQFISHWKKVKEQHLLNQVEKARTQNKLAIGIQEVLKAALQNKGRLLVIETNYSSPFQKTITYEPFSKIDSSYNDICFIKNELDEIIEKVLEGGGDVEFVDDGILNNCGQIALIKNY